MAEKNEILNLTINTDAAVESIKKLTIETKALKKTADDLKKSQGETSDAYIKANAEYKASNEVLRTQETLLKNVVKTNNDQTQSITAMRTQLSVVSKQWADLTKEQRENTEEGKKLAKQKLDLTNALKDEEKATGDARREVGNYAEAISDTIPGFDGMVNGAKTAGSAFLKLAMNPIVLTLTAIVGAATLLWKAFNRNEESGNKLTVIWGKVSGLFQGFLRILEPIANVVGNVLIKAFDGLSSAATKAINLLAKALDFVGATDAAAKVKSFGDEMGKAATEGGKLAKMQQEYTKALRESEIIQLEFQKKAEKLRQIRDDESKSLSVRKKANEDLNKVLQQQFKEEIAIAQKGLDLANAKIKLEGKTSENLDAEAEARKKIADISERIAGQESEYLANVNSLRKEGQAKNKEAKDKEVALNKEANNKKLADDMAYAEAKFSLLQSELKEWEILNKSKLDSSKQLNDDIINAEKLRLETLSTKQIEVLNKQKENELNNANLTKEQKEAIEKNYAVQILDINTQLNTNKSQLDTDYDKQKEDNAKLMAENEAIRKAGDLQVQMEIHGQELQAGSELEKQQLAIDAENNIAIRRKLGKDLQEDEAITDAAILAIKEDQAKKEKDIDRAVMDAKLGMASSTAGSIATIANAIAENGGKNAEKAFKVAKAANAAQATISTIQGGIGAYNGMVMSIPGPVGIALGAVAAAGVVASGYMNVKKILATNFKSPAAPTAPSAVSIPTGSAGAEKSVSTLQNASSEVGNGIVSRNTATPSLSTITQQTVLVVDDVTAKQRGIENVNKTSNL